MQTVKFTKDTEVEDRLYLAGQAHEFDKKTATELIDGGAAVDPAKAKEEKAPAVSEKSTVKTTGGKK